MTPFFVVINGKDLCEIVLIDRPTDTHVLDKIEEMDTFEEAFNHIDECGFHIVDGWCAGYRLNEPSDVISAMSGGEFADKISDNDCLILFISDCV